MPNRQWHCCRQYSFPHRARIRPAWRNTHCNTPNIQSSSGKSCSSHHRPHTVHSASTAPRCTPDSQLQWCTAHRGFYIAGIQNYPGSNPGSRQYRANSCCRQHKLLNRPHRDCQISSTTPRRSNRMTQRYRSSSYWDRIDTNCSASSIPPRRRGNATLRNSYCSGVRRITPRPPAAPEQ